MARMTEDESAARLRLHIAEAQKRLKQIETKQKAKDRARDTKRKIVLGGMVSAAMEKDPAFKAVIVAMAREKITRPSDKQAVADLLG